MTDVKVEVHGARALRTALRRAAGNLRDLSRLNQTVASIVVNAARPRAPRRTGRLAASIRPAKAATRATVRSTLVYAGVIHFGWPARNIKANPFATDAAQATEPRWTTVYQAGMQDVCDKVARSARGVGP